MNSPRQVEITDRAELRCRGATLARLEPEECFEVAQALVSAGFAELMWRKARREGWLPTREHEVER